MPIEAREGLPERVFVGKGWENKGGISISIKQAQIASLVPNEWGDVRLFVGRLKTPEERSKATHFVAVSEGRKTNGWVPPRAPSGMPSDPPGHTEKEDLPF